MIIALVNNGINYYLICHFMSFFFHHSDQNFPQNSTQPWKCWLRASNTTLTHKTFGSITWECSSRRGIVKPRGVRQRSSATHHKWIPLDPRASTTPPTTAITTTTTTIMMMFLTSWEWPLLMPLKWCLPTTFTGRSESEAFIFISQHLIKSFKAFII